LGTSALAELASVPSLENRWVAIDPAGGGATPERETPLKVALRSGAVVVDADAELDVLCARLKKRKLTSLTIVYAGKKS
jgi:hypothetical protein